MGHYFFTQEKAYRLSPGGLFLFAWRSAVTPQPLVCGALQN